MNSDGVLPGIPATFLYRDSFPGIMLDDGYALLFNFRTGDVVRASSSLVPSDGLLKTLHTLGFFDPPKDPISKDERLARLCLILTSSCNMRCVYCYNDSGSFHAKMLFGVAKAAIDAILRRPEIDYLLLQLYGGEPTLNPECLEEAISYAKKVSPVPVLPFVITNGTMRRSTLDFLVRNKTRFVFSCDLIRPVHDLQRPMLNGRSCFDQVIDNIKRAVDDHRTVSIRSVITNVNVNRMAEMVDIAAGLGAKEIILGPCEINVGRARFRQDITRPALEAYIRNYILALREAERRGIFLVDHIYRIFQAKESRQSEILFVLPDGSITQNSTVLDRQADNADRYITGALDLPNGTISYDQARRDRLQRNLQQNCERFCHMREACALLPICQGRYKAYEFTVEDETQDLDTFNCAYRKSIMADYVAGLVDKRQGQVVHISETEEITLFSDKAMHS